MKKLLILDRDGTLILEPEGYQIDSLEKLDFYPGVFQHLSRIVKELDFELVMITNQDGLGTEVFPEETFWPAHRKMMSAFEAEGISFIDVLIDRSFPEDNAPTRKPRTGLMAPYMNGDYDLANSFVVGDRLTDMELAKNLGAKGIWLNNQPDLGADEVEGDNRAVHEAIALSTTDWGDIYRFLRLSERTAKVQRTTKETDILIQLDLDGTGKSEMDTGLGFFDHMLDQLARHGGLDLAIKVSGDLEVDEHHTIEDTALALGEAFAKALGDKLGLERYGYALPMDDCLAQVAIDFGGRPWIVWEAEFKREKIGDMPTEMFFHFFKSFSDAAKANLNIKVEGTNEHHKIEAIFKAWARAIRMAKRRDTEHLQLPSTKGVL
ncbi:bifunctional histidinol-phosphatase/imidazoleglycerol-phosphate dehydratase HisB [Phaeodactylibacter sp.]|uniref:bifunctional histidinol-phosphatase/imidazoleglycerol-phosphate dehydratase HisB n=1 Tax=Phaeodactylibacter sp. TaxID=1940289 RepID=UPI0025DA1BAE|nr:bifunctional histidinol-phosphatase/imidazoleglycerol-phosphate dehydratase HisB [Phaeodactylibacter sp.]MCI4648273.1 bifunctional histidinol-phosphatase/imidazoleglycerol-phosphate dehydratase HisB [Phaeodactylibacter sp.]MCI5091872.1 bifunctional histidinol-phosphatase/imidazoleglycerol-phosphate dehydratase HisB [Phaeodactylibacter sp.]